MDILDLLEKAQENIGEDTATFEDYLNLFLNTEREVYIGDITENSGTSVDSIIRFWNVQDAGIDRKDRKPIKLYIDSYGGSLTDAFTIIDAIKLSETPVYTIVTGCAYSAGFFIAIAGEKRFCYKRSSFLYHEGSASNSGTASQFRNYSAFYEKQLHQLKDIVLENTFITEEEYNKHIKDDWWLDAEEAVNFDCVDEIITRDTMNRINSTLAELEKE